MKITRYRINTVVSNQVNSDHVPSFPCLDVDRQLKRILTFSVKDIYQLNYFICIKDLNTETITSLKLNLFSFSDHVPSFPCLDV
jgi:hypothetical protein